MAQLIPLGESVTSGERKTLDYLEQHLPNDWFVLGNPLISSGTLSRELDAIIIGDKWVWVVDEKAYSGVITGDENVWVLSNGLQIDRILYKVIHTASLVKGKMVRKVPSLRQVWVEPLILLSANDVQLEIDDTRIARHVHFLQGCERYLCKPHFPYENMIPPLMRAAIVRSLAGDLVADRYLLKSSDIKHLVKVDDQEQLQSSGAMSPQTETPHGERTSDYSTPTVHSTLPLIVQLEGTGGFRRIYYQDVLLGRRELRGAQPVDAVDDLESTSIQVHFTEDSIRIRPLGVAPIVSLDNKTIPMGEWTVLPLGLVTLTIGSLNFQARVEVMG